VCRTLNPAVRKQQMRVVPSTLSTTGEADEEIYITRPGATFSLLSWRG
jgi:hypothetical protein